MFLNCVIVGCIECSELYMWVTP